METVEKLKKFRSLTVTLALAFLTLCALILISIVTFEIYFQYQAQKNVISNQQQVIAQNAANTVKGFIQDRFTILETVASFSNFAETTLDSQNLSLEKLLGKESAFRQLVFFDKEEKELVKISRLSSFEPSQLEKATGSDFFPFVKKGETYISSVYIDKNTSEPLTAIAIPVKNIFGDYQGALVAEVNLKFMWELVGSIKVGQSGQVYVVDKQGGLLASYDISKVLSGKNFSELTEVAEFIQGIHTRNEVSVAKGIDGTNVATSHVHLGTPDWAVIVEIPLSEAYAPLYNTIKASVLIVVLSLVLVIIVSIYLSRIISRPLIKLRDASLAISQGKLETRIEVKSRDEIGQLAQAFNEMAVKLKESYTILEQKVEERTKELGEVKRKLEGKVQERTAEVESLKTRLEKEEYFKTILQTSIDGFWLTDLKGHFLDVNDAYCRLVGHSREELLKMSIPDVEAVENPEETRQRIEKIIKIGGDRFETRHRHKDGQIIDVEVSVNYSKKEGGLLFVFIRDIIERKKNETELKRRAEDSERINKMMVGRELKMIELKNEIEELKSKLNKS